MIWELQATIPRWAWQCGQGLSLRSVGVIQVGELWENSCNSADPKPMEKLC